MMPQFGLKVNNSNSDMSNYRTVAQDQRQSKVMSTFSSSSLRKLSQDYDRRKTQELERVSSIFEKRKLKEKEVLSNLKFTIEMKKSPAKKFNER